MISDDGGATWSQFYGQPANFLTYQMVVDPVAPTTLFLAQTYAPLNSGPISGSLFATANRGASWTQADSGLGLGSAVISTMIGTSVSGTLYVATVPGNSSPNATHGLFKTADAGTTWTPLTSAPDMIAALAADPTNPSIVYAGTTSGVFKSTDGGATFASASTGLTNTSVSSFAINPLHPSNVFVGTAGGVFQSRDGGSTWQSMSLDQYVFSLAIDSNGRFLHAGTGYGVFDFEFAENCFPDAHTLCLNAGRFSITATFQPTSEGPSTPANAVPLTPDTGYFWFFDPTNVEVVTKVLDGCSTNGHYWFFASGLTNVGVQINVTDTLTGASRPYSNSFGTPFPPIQDTAAFPCP
jgi:hypothetical protein